jgi:GWxTD domain-containing protein
MIRGPGRVVLTTLALVILVTVSSLAAPPGRSGSLLFYVDVVTEPTDDLRSRTTLYFQIPINEISVKTETGGLYITLEIEPGEGDSFEEGRVFRELEGVNRGGILLFEPHLDFSLPPGGFKMQVRVEDLETDGFGEMRVEGNVPEYADQKLAAGDLIFGLCGDPGNPDDLVAHPSHRYGDDLPAPCMQITVVDQMEAGPDSAYRIRYELKDRTGRKVMEETLEIPRDQRKLRISPSMGRLGAGEYELKVQVRLDGEKVDRRGNIRVDSSRISLGDPEKIRTILGYVATNAELALLDDAPDDSLEVLWDRFWARRDPSPGKPNEAMMEFLRRVEYATSMYGGMDPGWGTDLGEIHIRYGSPDRVENLGEAGFRSSTQIWHYDQRGLSFVFQDFDGFGHYILTGRRD